MARKKVKFDVNPLLSGPSLVDRNKLGNPYREIPLTEIDVDPHQPRKAFEEASLKDLASSIQANGVLCPIRVRLTEGGTYRIVAGERRYRACSMLGLESIPAVIDRGEGDEVDLLVQQVVENVQRVDLNPVERSRAIAQLKETFGLSVREVSTKLGISKSAVQRGVEISNLPADLLVALEEGAAESKILMLSKLGNKTQRKKLLARLDQLSRSELQTIIDKLTGAGQVKGTEDVSHGGTDSSEDSERQREDQRIVDELQHSLGLRVSIHRQSGASERGKLSAEFYSAEDLELLFQRLIAG